LEAPCSRPDYTNRAIIKVYGAATGKLKIKGTLVFFEPGPSTWQAEVLARLYYSRKP